METIKEALKTFKGKVVAAVVALIVAVAGAVQVGIVDVAEIATTFIGEKVEQIDE